MNIPCKECLVFACCRNRAVEKDNLFIQELKCEILKKWFGMHIDSDMRATLKKLFKVQYLFIFIERDE